MDIILLRILIFIFFCLIGLGMVSLVGSRAGNHKKVDLLKKSVTEECSDSICPEPDIWDGNKSLKKGDDK